MMFDVDVRVLMDPGRFETSGTASILGRNLQPVFLSNYYCSDNKLWRV